MAGPSDNGDAAFLALRLLRFRATATTTNKANHTRASRTLFGCCGPRRFLRSVRSTGGTTHDFRTPDFCQPSAPIRCRLDLVRGYHLLVAIEKTLLDQGVHSSWASVRDALATHAIVTIVLPTDSGATLRIRKASTAESEHCELYRLLGVDEKIMSPKTIWSETRDHE